MSTAPAQPLPRVDAHLHLWDLERCAYDWLTPDLGPLARTFTAAEARAELDAAGFSNAILVQAADSTCDTDLMLDTAAHHDWVAGVVGWVPLTDPQAAGRELDRRLAAASSFVGVRHLTHVDPDPELLWRGDVRTSLRLVAERDLVFEVPDAWPRHLAVVAEIADEIPSLRIVVDHLGKPPIEGADFADWAATLRRVAEHPNVSAKLSGLHTTVAEERFSAEALTPAVDVALEAFGAERLIYGGDWPMPVPLGGYQPVWTAMQQVLERFEPSARDAVLGGNAQRWYRLAWE